MNIIKNFMNIIILGVRIIEDSDNRGSENRGCTVKQSEYLQNVTAISTECTQLKAGKKHCVGFCCYTFVSKYSECFTDSFT